MGTLRKLLNVGNLFTPKSRFTDKTAKKSTRSKFGKYLSGKPQYHGNPIYFPKRTKLKGWQKENRRKSA
jgi:hypothetical protein